MLVRYRSPFAGLAQLDAEFNRLVNAGFGGGATRYSPTADVVTEGGDVLITLAVPGVAAEDIDVTLEGRRLSITAERREREVAEGDRYLARGLRAGTFRRVFTVPEGLTAEQVSANVENGLLTVRLAEVTKPAPQPQKIAVTAAIDSRAIESE